MASQPVSQENLSISQQHAFLDCAKEFKWEEVKRHINAYPDLVNVQPAARWSALHQAAFSGDGDAVRFLLSHGARSEATSREGQRPFDVAKGCAKVLLASTGCSARMPTPLCELGAVLKSGGAKHLKAMKVGKVAKGKKKTTSKIAKGKRGKALVYKGQFVKTVGGLTKDHLAKSKSGKIVSKRLQAHGKNSYGNIKSWVEAFLKARREMGLQGFVALKKGSALYVKTMELYKS